MKVTEKGLEARRKNALLGGRPKGSIASHTMDAIEAKKLFVAKVHERLLPIFEALYEKAVTGDVNAIKELLDRAWGKAIQGVEVGTKDGTPIIFMPVELTTKYALQSTPNVLELEDISNKHVEDTLSSV